MIFLNLMFSFQIIINILLGVVFKLTMIEELPQNSSSIMNGLWLKIMLKELIQIINKALNQCLLLEFLQLIIIKIQNLILPHISKKNVEMGLLLILLFRREIDLQPIKLTIRL